MTTSLLEISRLRRIFLMTAAIALLLVASQPARPPIGIQTQILELCSILCILLAGTKGLGIRLLIVAPISFWVWHSASWSLDPSATLKGFQLLVLVLLAGVSIGSYIRLSAPTIIAVSSMMAAVSSWVYLLLAPSKALNSSSYQSGALQGVYEHRNVLGYVMASGLVVCFALSRARPTTRLYLLGGIFLALTLVATRSGTALVVALATIAIVHGVAWSSQASNQVERNLRSAYTLATASLSVWVLWIGRDAVLALIGRDETLTGRSQIWRVVRFYIEQKPTYGYGYRAVWGPDEEFGRSISSSVGFYVPHAHSGYLDLALQIGVVGLAIVAACVVVLLFSCLRATLAGNLDALPALAICISQILYNIDESRITYPFAQLLIAIVAGTLLASRQQTSRPPRSISPIVADLTSSRS